MSHRIISWCEDCKKVKAYAFMPDETITVLPELCSCSSTPAIYPGGMIWHVDEEDEKIRRIVREELRNLFPEKEEGI